MITKTTSIKRLKPILFLLALIINNHACIVQARYYLSKYYLSK